MKPYWHELSKEWRAAEIMRRAFGYEFKQPPWCTMPNAMDGIMGCWSLVSISSRIKTIKDCWNCNYNKKRALEDCHCETDVCEMLHEEE
jgi:hypothetical protein